MGAPKDMTQDNINFMERYMHFSRSMSSTVLAEAINHPPGFPSEHNIGDSLPVPPPFSVFSATGPIIHDKIIGCLAFTRFHVTVETTRIGPGRKHPPPQTRSLDLPALRCAATGPEVIHVKCKCRQVSGVRGTCRRST
jgi:hypothetical protein